MTGLVEPGDRIPIVGFVTPPGWFDPSPGEFPSACAAPVRVQQTVLSLPGFDWRLESIALTEGVVANAVAALADTGCDVVAKVGTPFGWAGLPTIAQARARADRWAAATGVTVVTAASAIFDVLAGLGVGRVGLACTYYNDTWTEHWADFVGASGVEVVGVNNFTRLGLMPPHEADDRDHWEPKPTEIADSIRRLADTAQGAEAIVVSGAGARTLSLVAPLSDEIGYPVLGSDTALYWATARAAGVPLRADLLGRLSDV